jgi:hypothetical protein
MTEQYLIQFCSHYPYRAHGEIECYGISPTCLRNLLDVGFDNRLKIKRKFFK